MCRKDLKRRLPFLHSSAITDGAYQNDYSAPFSENIENRREENGAGEGALTGTNGAVHSHIGFVKILANPRRSVESNLFDKQTH